MQGFNGKIENGIEVIISNPLFLSNSINGVSNMTTRNIAKVISPHNVQKFWSKVALTANPDKCWEWQGSKTAKGYGIFTANGVICRTHRLSYLLANGIISDLFILHSCDNPCCVNPNHLREGTHQENMQDRRSRPKRRKLTMPKEKMPSQIKQRRYKLLAESKVEIIKYLLGHGITQQKIADMFEVNVSTINRIALGKTHAE
jgi:hypothetical protein